MENAVQALKMAFAVIVFVLALSVAMHTFSLARQTADVMITRADETSYYEYQEYTKSGKASENRIVSFETIIPTLYKYSKERYKVIFKEGTYNTQTGEITNVKNLARYETQTARKNWDKDYTNDFDGETTNSSSASTMKICSFDIAEETQRHEPWVGNEAQIKLHLDKMISGVIYHLPQYDDAFTKYDLNYELPPNNTLNRLFSGKGIKGGTALFLEQIGRYDNAAENLGENNDDETTAIRGNNTTTKTVITYILINNSEEVIEEETQEGN